MRSPALLPKRLQEKVRDMPESTYEATRCVVILDDGTRIPDVYIAWGKEIVKVGQSSRLPFDTSRVIDLELQKE